MPLFVRIISLILLLLIGLGVLTPAISEWSHEEAHQSDCLEFGHIHTNEDEECHGAMITGTLFFPQSEFNSLELLTVVSADYPIAVARIYNDPWLSNSRKPPRLT